LVPADRGSSSPKKVATLPKASSAASFAVKKLKLGGDRVLAREDGREALAPGALTGATPQAAYPHGHVAEQGTKGDRVGAAAAERTTAAGAVWAEPAVTLDLGKNQPVLKGGQQLLGFLNAQAQPSQGQLVRSHKGQKIVFGDHPGSGFGNEFDGPLHGREPRPGPAYHNSLCSHGWPFIGADIRWEKPFWRGTLCRITSRNGPSCRCVGCGVTAAGDGMQKVARSDPG
jgi:hypothetical protein